MNEKIYRKLILVLSPSHVNFDIARITVNSLEYVRLFLTNTRV